MTVKELIELNQMITDVEITIRGVDSHMIDQLNIGPSEGIKPPYPQRVPRRPNVPIAAQHDDYFYKDAAYIDKSINSWDDGRDYWELKVNRIPKKWLDLEVTSWGVWPASTIGSSGRRSDFTGKFKNVNFHGQRINIETLPSGEVMEVKEKKEPEAQIEGQVSLEDWWKEDLDRYLEENLKEGD